MGSKRTLILIVAVVIGLVAVYTLFNYVNGIEDRAYENAERVNVFVVKGDIPKSMSGAEAIGASLLDVDMIPQEFYPSTAVTDLALIKDKMALFDLVPGQVLVTGMFVDRATLTITSAERIPVGEVAISMNFDTVRSVAGLIAPGDRVNMIMVSADMSQYAQPAEGESPLDVLDINGDGWVVPRGAQMLYQNVKVLAVGQSVVSDSGEGAVTTNSGLITFTVPAEAAERLAIANEVGGVYLTLLPPTYTPADIPPISDENFFPLGQLQPYPTGG